MRYFVHLLHRVADALDDRDPKHVTSTLEAIRDNHLAHIQASLDDLHVKYGRIDARLTLLLGGISLILMALMPGIIAGVAAYVRGT